MVLEIFYYAILIKRFKLTKKFFFSILKSGDFKDDSGIFFNINKKKFY